MSTKAAPQPASALTAWQMGAVPVPGLPPVSPRKAQEAARIYLAAMGQDGAGEKIPAMGEAESAEMGGDGDI